MVLFRILFVLLTCFQCVYCEDRITPLYENRNPTHTDIVTSNIRRAVIEYVLDREYAVKRYGPIEDWDTSEVTDMSFLFFYGRCPKNRYMHICADRLKHFNEDISRWDVSSVTSMESMFFNSHEFDRDISRWDTSKVQKMSRTFYGTQKFNSDISRWDVSSVTESEYAFKGAKKFVTDLSSWGSANGVV